MPLHRDQTLWLVTIKEDAIQPFKPSSAHVHPYLKNDDFDPSRFELDLFHVKTLSNDMPFWVYDSEMRCDIVLHQLVPDTFEVRKFRSLFDLISYDNELYIGCTEEVNRMLTDEEHTLLRRLNDLDQ